MREREKERKLERTSKSKENHGEKELQHCGKCRERDRQHVKEMEKTVYMAGGSCNASVETLVYCIYVGLDFRKHISTRWVAISAHHKHCTLV